MENAVFSASAAGAGSPALRLCRQTATSLLAIGWSPGPAPPAVTAAGACSGAALAGAEAAARAGVGGPA